MKVPLSVGFDEAGLGPVMGPLVIGCAVVEPNEIAILKRLGVRDSKQFGAGQRARAHRHSVLEKSIGHLRFFDYFEIPAKELDQALLDGRTMYDLEIEGIRALLRRCLKLGPTNLFFDQLGQMRQDTFLRKLGLRSAPKSNDRIGSIVYEQSADQHYTPVSMASIIAKCARDKRVEEICNRMGREYVSGYPTKVTARFLEEYVGQTNSLPEHVRVTRKWEPLQALIAQIGDETRSR